MISKRISQWLRSRLTPRSSWPKFHSAPFDGPVVSAGPPGSLGAGRGRLWVRGVRRARCQRVHLEGRSSTRLGCRGDVRCPCRALLWGLVAYACQMSSARTRLTSKLQACACMCTPGSFASSTTRALGPLDYHTGTRASCLAPMTTKMIIHDDEDEPGWKTISTPQGAAA